MCEVPQRLRADYSRFILAWRLQADMTAASLIEVVQEAVERTGMTEVPLRDRTALLSDNGPGYLSRVFARYLWLLGIRHIVASPYHPQIGNPDPRTKCPGVLVNSRVPCELNVRPTCSPSG